MHGANRLGTNSLLDIVVFGRRGGDDMVAHCAEADLAIGDVTTPTRDLLDGILTRRDGDNAADIRAELQDSMFDLAFVVRTEEGLAKMHEILDGLRERYERISIGDTGSVYNTDLMEAVEPAPAGLRRGARRGRAGPRREPRRPLPRGSPAPRRRELAEALARVPADDRSIRLETKPVKMGPTSRWSASTDGRGSRLRRGGPEHLGGAPRRRDRI